MSSRFLELERFLKPGQTIKLSRQELAGSTEEGFDRFEERAMLSCLQRLAAIPRVEGLALSRIRGNGVLYYTIVERLGPPSSEETGQTFREIMDAVSGLGDALGEIMPGSFINLGESEKFARAARYFRTKRYQSELELLGVIQFTE